jgi:class 3 adenylate cyclase
LEQGETVNCPSCGRENRQGQKFCVACGSRLIVACAHCGTQSEPGERFCGECGRPVDEQAAAPPSAPSPASRSRSSGGFPASVADGRYRLERFLGEGGRKRVYLAHDTRLARDVAIALIKTDGLDELGFTRVRREAESMGRLGDHPHVVTIHDIGEDEGQLYIVSQYMIGGDLDELLSESDDRRVPVARAVAVAQQICRALEHAHGHGIVHRDLKPQNVWLTDDGTAKLGDFGLAVALDRSRITLEGMMVGTVAYMPPEQALGQPADARSDLYSLGALLYELVCGRQPFVGDDVVAVISQHINTAPVAPSWHNANVAQPLEELILKLLAKAPEERPPNAAAVRERLEALSSGELVAPAPVAHDRANPLDRLATGVFIGRERETKELRAGLEAALSGRLRLMTLAGEMGIGKTRMAAELATYASLRGAQVVWGRCYEGEGAPAYWPWVQIIRSYVHDRDPHAISSEMGSGAADIAQVVSEVRDRLPGLPAPPTMEPEQARFRLFDSIATFLRNAARARPLVMILDDLHWADKSSLLLLRFLASELRESRALVLGTYRDTELERGHPLADVLAGLRREPSYKRVLLRGLSAEETKSLLEAVAEHQLGPGELMMVEALHAETEGNPFFVEEIVRHLVETGRLYRNEGRWVTGAHGIEDLGIPEGVQETIVRRLALLSEQCNDVLATASVIGREFRVDVLERVTELSGDALLETLDEAVAAHVIADAPGSIGRYRFSHGLTREALYEQLTTTRRVRLHARIATTLEALYADSVEAHLAELACHYNEAVLVGGADKAVDYATRAAQRASSMLAFEEAVAHYERASQALQLKEPVDLARHCELLLAKGDAQWRAGDTGDAKSTLRNAAEIARTVGSPEQLAHAALSYGAGLGGFGVADRADAVLVELLEEALEALPDVDSSLRVRLLARLAVELYYDHRSPRERRAELSQQAVDMAERLNDTPARLVALYSRHWSLLGPDGLDEQLAAATDILDLAEKASDKEMAFRGHHFRLHSLLQRGDMEAVDAEIEACASLARELRQPLYHWQTTSFRAMRALFDGDFEATERLAREALELGQRGQSASALVHFGSQTLVQYWAQGRLDELVDATKQFVERYPWSSWRAALAFQYGELGREAEARAEFEPAAEREFADLPRDGNWMIGLMLFAVACAALGDEKHAEVLYGLMLPYADRTGVAVAGAACMASVDFELALLAATMRRWDDAERHFEAARARDARIGARPFLARGLYEHASMLIARDGPGDRAEARRLSDRALGLARELGMPRLTEQLLAQRLEDQGLRSLNVQTSVDAVVRSVEAERPNLRQHASPDGTVTVLMSDIEGSTEITERLGDGRWLEVLRSHNSIVREQIRLHRGFEVKAQGDGFMIAFSSARRALDCAIAIQRAFAGYRERRREEPLNVRIGLHTGEALKDQDDFFGRNVILAARIAAQARGGEILVSSVVKALSESGGDLHFESGRDLELKGLSGTHRVFAVAWQEPPTPLASRAYSVRAPSDVA